MPEGEISHGRKKGAISHEHSHHWLRQGGFPPGWIPQPPGHAVSIVDRSPWAFDRLDDDFTGYTVEGIPIDGDVLKEAGIEGCDILVAVTNDDNINLMVGQMAKEIFGVPKVLARLMTRAGGMSTPRWGCTWFVPPASPPTIFSRLLRKTSKREPRYR